MLVLIAAILLSLIAGCQVPGVGGPDHVEDLLTGHHHH
jgi:hypothetical protein